MENKIAHRVYTSKKQLKKKPRFQSKEIPLLHSRIFIFDTETTNDEFQNFKFGSFLIIDNYEDELKGIFYSSENISKKEEQILRKYSKENNIDLFILKEFIEDIFYPEILDSKTLCMGFNLPFDLSRLIIHWSAGRYGKENWFSFQLSENNFLPRIRIKHIDSTMSFIEFTRNKKNLRGYFLDLKTLSSIFSENKHISLGKAGEFFNCELLKTEAEEHGKINKKYIEYNLNDVKATYELYLKILEHYKKYGIDIPITKIYSSASLGKYALKQLGIQPLSKINSNINAKIKGNLMSAYFGGRCETILRKTPLEISVLDFTSMYPSLTINMGLWEFIIAKEIKEIEVTNEIIDFLKNLKLEDLGNKKIWKELNVLVELIPDNDYLPVRSNYLEGSSIYNVGLNYLKHKNSFYYAIPDVINSMIKTAKLPKIKKAIRFIPIGKQETLNLSEILGIKIDPSKENFIKKLVEERQKFKEKRDFYEKDSQEDTYYDGLQKALKILSNSTAYGIFIEMNQQNKESELDVNSSQQFFTRQKLEEEGKFFNPLIAVMQVAGARLLLAMAENYMKEKGSMHVYMDTDSCYVPSDYAQGLRDFFKSLNPYDFDTDFFKIEKEKLMFYGISAKRYVLYKIKENNKIEIIDYKLHGLGHLLNPYGKEVNWQKQIWQDILDFHYKNISKLDLINKYSNFYAISKLAISTPQIAKRFKEFNKNKSLNKQIKPFNFFLIGQGINKDIKPITSYSKNSQSKVYDKFIDYKSGKVLEGIEYWKSLADIIFDYMDHPESKFENGNAIGFMKRRKISGGKIVFIGKETKDLEKQSLEIENINEYLNERELKKKILTMTSKESREKGVKHRSTLKRIKDKIRRGEKINWKTKSIKNLLR